MERVSSWKKNIDDIKIICKQDGREMILESSWNYKNGIYVCPGCGSHVNIEVKN